MGFWKGKSMIARGIDILDINRTIGLMGNKIHVQLGLLGN